MQINQPCWKQLYSNGAYWCPPVISAFGKLRQEDGQFKAGVAITKYETRQNIHTREKWVITKSIKSQIRPLSPFPENSVVCLECAHTYRRGAAQGQAVLRGMWGSSISRKCLRGAPLHVRFTVEQTPWCGRWSHTCTQLCPFKSGCGVTCYAALSCLTVLFITQQPSHPLLCFPQNSERPVHITLSQCYHLIVQFHYQLLLLIPDASL